MKSSLHFTTAHWPRETEWSTIAPTSRLEVAYKVHVNEQQRKNVNDETHLNLIFLHDTGLIKDIWDPYALKFFELFGQHLNKVVAIDCVTHGDSYLANKQKLGWVATARDYGKDVVEIVKNVERLSGVCILIGHGRGGLAALYAADYEPMLFDSVIVIQPTLECLPMGIKFQQLGSMHPDFIKSLMCRGQKNENKVRAMSNVVSLEQQRVCTYSLAYDCLDRLIPILRRLSCEVLYVDLVSSYSDDPAWVAREALKCCTWVDINDPTGSKNLPFVKFDEVYSVISTFMKRRFVRGASLWQTALSRSLLTNDEKMDYVEKNLVDCEHRYPDIKIYSKI